MQEYASNVLAGQRRVQVCAHHSAISHKIVREYRREGAAMTACRELGLRSAVRRARIAPGAAVEQSPLLTGHEECSSDVF